MSKRSAASLESPAKRQSTRSSAATSATSTSLSSYVPKHTAFTDSSSSDDDDEDEKMALPPPSASTTRTLFIPTSGMSAAQVAKKQADVNRKIETVQSEAAEKAREERERQEKLAKMDEQIQRAKAEKEENDAKQLATQKELDQKNRQYLSGKIDDDDEEMHDEDGEVVDEDDEDDDDGGDKKQILGGGDSTVAMRASKQKLTVSAARKLEAFFNQSVSLPPFVEEFTAADKSFLFSVLSVSDNASREVLQYFDHDSVETEWKSFRGDAEFRKLFKQTLWRLAVYAKEVEIATRAAEKLQWILAYEVEQVKKVAQQQLQPAATRMPRDVFPLFQAEFYVKSAPVFDQSTAEKEWIPSFVEFIRLCKHWGGQLKDGAESGNLQGSIFSDATKSAAAASSSSSSPATAAPNSLVSEAKLRDQFMWNFRHALTLFASHLSLFPFACFFTKAQSHHRQQCIALMLRLFIDYKHQFGPLLDSILTCIFDRIQDEFEASNGGAISDDQFFSHVQLFLSPAVSSVNHKIVMMLNELYGSHQRNSFKQQVIKSAAYALAQSLATGTSVDKCSLVRTPTLSDYLKLWHQEEIVRAIGSLRMKNQLQANKNVHSFVRLGWLLSASLPRDREQALEFMELIAQFKTVTRAIGTAVTSDAPRMLKEECEMLTSMLQSYDRVVRVTQAEARKATIAQPIAVGSS